MPRLFAACCLWLLSLALPAAERVASLAPALTELMLELDAGALLVAAVDGGPRPPPLAALPSLGRYDQLQLETLIDLQPDLVLAWSDSLSPAQRRQLQQLGLPLFEVAPRDLEQLAEVFVRLGARVGRAEQGRQLAARFRQGIARLRAANHREPPLPVFYQVWAQPLYTLGGRQIVSAALPVCGAQNLFADLDLPAPQVSIEAVLQRDPAVILLSSAEQAAAWQAWPQLRAVQRGQVWAIADPGLERPSFQMLAALERLCAQLRAAH